MSSSLRNTDFRSLLNQVGATSAASGKDEAQKTQPSALGAKEKHKQRYLQILRRQKQREAKSEREAKAAASAPRFRDRAAERRNQTGEYADAAKDFHLLKERSLEESKYLGGDINHTHLVKGLDFALLSKVRSELEKKNDLIEPAVADEVKEASRTASIGGGSLPFDFVPTIPDSLPKPSSNLAKRIVTVLTHGLHPHHVSFKQKLERVEAVVNRGSHFRGNTTQFYPGRMRYQFSLDHDESESPGRKRQHSPPVAIFQALKSTMLQPPEGCIAPLPTHVAALFTVNKNDLGFSHSSTLSHSSFNAQQKQPSSLETVARPDEADDEDIFANVGSFNPAEQEPYSPVDLSSTLDVSSDAAAPCYQYFERNQTPSSSNAAAPVISDALFEASAPEVSTGSSEERTRHPCDKPVRATSSGVEEKKQRAVPTASKRRLYQEHINNYSECYPGLATESSSYCCWDDDDDDDDDGEAVTKKSKRKSVTTDQDTKPGAAQKTKLSARAARRQAEREWKTLEGYIESKKHRNLDVIERDLSYSVKSVASRSAGFPDVI